MKTITINIDTPTEIILDELVKRTGFDRNRIIMDCIKGFAGEIMQGETIKRTGEAWENIEIELI